MVRSTSISSAALVAAGITIVTLLPVGVPFVSPAHAVIGIDTSVPPLSDIATAAEGGSGLVDVIVTYQEGVDVAAELASVDPVAVEHVFDEALNGAAVTVSTQELAELEVDPQVRRVERNTAVYPVFDTSASTSSWALDRIDQSRLPLDQSFESAGTGVGVRIYVLDTGFERTHVEFDQASIEPGVDIVTPVDPNSVGGFRRACLGHGTHVTSAIAGATLGVAPGATIVPVRVLDCDNDSAADVIKGLDAIIGDVQQRPTNKAIANLSLGGSASASLDDAVRRAVQAGISVVVAAGNFDADACQTSPARAPLAITVGATDQRDRRASFSNFGRCLDVFAPGVGVRAATFLTRNDVIDLNGTSMSAPYVSGVVAVLAEVHSESSISAAGRMLANSTSGLVTSAGRGSPNRLVCLSGAGTFEVATTDLVPGVTRVRYGGGPLSVLGGKSPYQWRLVDGRLPNGYTLSSAGQISGTTRRTGTYTFTVEVADNACRRTSRQMTLQVLAPSRLTP